MILAVKLTMCSGKFQPIILKRYYSQGKVKTGPSVMTFKVFHD